MSKLEYLLDLSDYLVTFIRVAITGVPENISLPSHFDWEALYTLSERHKLSSAAWRGIQTCQLNVPAPLYDKWYIRTQQALSKVLRFEHELAQIQSAFAKAGIDYVLMKGVSLQKYWPDKGLREFSDHDILIREEHRELAKETMFSLGYKNTHFGGVHDVYEKEPIYDVEIHVALFEPHFSFSPYFQDIWDRVEPVSGMEHQYCFTFIDFYLFFLFHFAKHAQNRGSGLRFYADLYLLQEGLRLTDEEQQTIIKKITELDPQHRVQELYTTTDSLFRNKGVLSPQTKELIFSGNAYGGHTQSIYNSMREKGTWKYVIFRLFPSRSALVKRYKILQPLPFMLPFVWIYRFIHHFFTGFHRKRIFREIRDVKRFSGDEVKK